MYDANPAANAFIYKSVVLNRSMYLESCCSAAGSTSNWDNVLQVYHGVVTAWAGASFQFLIWEQHWRLAAGGAGQYFGNNFSTGLHLLLEPGTYTFACYSITDIAQAKFVFALSEA